MVLAALSCGNNSGTSSQATTAAPQEVVPVVETYITTERSVPQESM